MIIMFFFVLVFWMTWLQLPNKKIDCFPAHQTRTRIECYNEMYNNDTQIPHIMYEIKWK